MNYNAGRNAHCSDPDRNSRVTTEELIPSVEEVAAHRRLPRNQFHCPTCGGAHVYGSERSKHCGQTASRSAPRRSTVPRAPVHPTNWTTSPTSRYTPPRIRTAPPPAPPGEHKPKPDRKAER